MTKGIKYSVIRYIIDRPNKVVHKADIMLSCGLTANQVTAAILDVQRTSMREIETIVRGNSWRYAPRQPSTTIVARDADHDLPLTTLIRYYLIDHPYQAVTIEQLIKFTDRREEQVRSGVNNLRGSKLHVDVALYISVIVAGYVWKFTPPDNWRPGGQVATTHNTSIVPTDDESSGGRVFEEIGELRDGRIMIRDQDGNTYTATPA